MKNERYLWDTANYKFWSKLIIWFSNYNHFKFRPLLPKINKNHFFRFQMQIKLICACIISIFQLNWIEYLKLLHKNNFFTILHLRLLKCWPSNFTCVVIKLICGGQYHYHNWTYHILDMTFFNCIKRSSPLSNFTFQMDLVAEICINKLWYTPGWPHVWPTPNSSGQHPSGLASSK